MYRYDDYTHISCGEKKLFYVTSKHKLVDTGYENVYL